MGFNTNTIDRLPARKAINVIEVFTMDDFPAAVAGVRTLPSGTYNVMVDGLSTSDRFDVEASQSVVFSQPSDVTDVFFYTGTGVFITGTNATNVRFKNFDLTLTNGLATFADITGGGFGLDDTTVAFSNGGTLGTFVNNSRWLFRRSVFLGYDNGMVITTPSVLFSTDSIMQSNFIGTGTFITIDEGVVNAFLFRGLLVVGSPLESVFNISPLLTLPSEITDTSPIGAPALFKSGVTGSITLFADSSNTAVTITSVDSGNAAPGGGNFALFFFTPGPTLFEGQQVTVSGYTTNTAYNVTGIVTNDVDTGEFSINDLTGNPVLFGTDEAGGSFISNSVTVTSTAHGLSNLTTLLITETIDYNAGYTIYNSLTNTFRINASFVTGETNGSWDTGSLTERSKFVNANNNGPTKNSMNIAFGEMNGNANVTVIAVADTYQAMDFTGMTNNPASELWTLIDPVAGVYRYDGVTPFTGSVLAVLSATKTGTTANYRFTISIDGAIPVFASAPYAPMEVKTTKVSTTVLKPASITPGQTVQIMGAGDGTSDNLTATDYVLEIKV